MVQDPHRLDVTLEHVAAGATEPGTSRRITVVADDAAVAARPAWNAFARTHASVPTRCPITGKPVDPDSPTYPFFDERARMADLGRWMSGSYSVSREVDPDDEPGPGSGDA